MSEDQRFDTESLRKSVQQVGRLYPRLVNQDGKVLDGNHRADADKDWEVKVVPTENRFKELLVRAHAHHRRRVPQEETRALIEEMAETLVKDGVPTSEVATKLVDCLPYNENYVRSLIPEIYKNPVKAQAGQIRGEKAAAISRQKAATISEQKPQTVKISDRLSSTIVSCDRCHVFTSYPVAWHNHQLCESCHTKALADPDGFNGYFSAVNKKPEPKTSNISKPLISASDEAPPLKDSWEHRKAQMSPQKSAFEERVVNRFRQILGGGLGFAVDTDREFCVLATKPDAYVSELSALAYIDGPVHTPKREDKDERLRELLKKHHDELNIQGFKYKADTKAEEDRVLNEMQKWIEGLSGELQKWKTGSVNSKERTEVS